LYEPVRVGELKAAGDTVGDSDDEGTGMDGTLIVNESSFSIPSLLLFVVVIKSATPGVVEMRFFADCALSRDKLEADIVVVNEPDETELAVTDVVAVVVINEVLLLLLLLLVAVGNDVLLLSK
jgi:hypothetical protein